MLQKSFTSHIHTWCTTAKPDSNGQWECVSECNWPSQMACTNGVHEKVREKKWKIEWEKIQELFISIIMEKIVFHLCLNGKQIKCKLQKYTRYIIQPSPKPKICGNESNTKKKITTKSVSKYKRIFIQNENSSRKLKGSQIEVVVVKLQHVDDGDSCSTNKGKYSILCFVHSVLCVCLYSIYSLHKRNSCTLSNENEKNRAGADMALVQ